MPEGLVLDTPAGFVELGVGVFHDMERIGHLGGPGHHGVEDGPIGTREIEGCPLDPRAELEPLVIEPLRRPAGASTRDDIEELAGSDIRDRGGELLTAITAPSHEEHLVEPERTDVSKAPGMLDQRLAIAHHGVVDGMPITPELLGHLGDAPRAASHLGGHPASGTVGHRHPRSCDTRVLLGPAAHRTVRVITAPPPLVPVQPSGLAEGRQIDEHHLAPTLELGHHTARRAANGSSKLLDV